MKTTRLFVYGTLRRGERNAGLMATATFVREGKTAPRHTLYALDGHPGMGAGGETSVLGEVFDVDAATLGALDELEGHPTWYRRVVVTLADGEEVETYVLPPRFTKGRECIEHGDWVHWRTHGNASPATGR